MKKKYVIVIAVLLAACVAVFAGCGEQGEKGERGEPGRDGLSAYEIFCKNYIYIESEKQWIDDLVSGTLERIDNSVLEEKEYWPGSINYDFTDDKVWLMIDKYFYQKEYTVEDFHMIEVEKVELGVDLTDGGQKPGNKTYWITLKEKSKQAVIDAIHKLEIYAFTKSACPNEIDSPWV